MLGKEERVFNNVFDPKVKGTWLIDKLTENEPLDFFVMFSSTASIFSEPGQGDYAAANSFLDSYTAYRNKLGKRTVTINWTTWRDIGMALAYGVNVDGVFKAIPTQKGVEAFNEIMNRDVKRVMVGELNTSSDYLQILENVKVKLSFKLKNAVEISKMRAAGSKSSLDNVLSKEVKLVGMEGSNDYSEIDEKLARMYSSILGFTEINIYDNFFELGGDSILLSQLYEFIEEEFPERSH